MKILFIASQPYFEWRGSPIRVGFDVMALAELGHEVDLFVLPMGEAREIPGVRIFRAPALPWVRQIPIGPSFSKLVFDFVMLVQGLWMARRNRYDVVHAVEDAGMVAIVIGAVTGARVVFEKHSDPSSYRKSVLRNLIMWAYGKVERFMIRHADASIGTGPGLLAQIELACSGKPAYSIADVASSLVEAEPGRTAEVAVQLRASPDEVLATFVGSFAIYQGIDLLFAAIPHVVRQAPNVRFVIIGGTPGEIAKRGEELALVGVGGNVTFVGRVSPDCLPDYLAASDILLSPRLGGLNTPLKLLDYMKAGRAIVATNNAANRQILDEHTALLVEPEPESFAAGIVSLARDSALRGRLGENGRIRFDERHNYTRFRQGLDDCYRRLVEKQA